MKLRRVFMIALMTSAFAVVGCDSGSGGGGGSASEVCDECDNSNFRPACESAYNTWRNTVSEHIVSRA